MAKHKILILGLDVLLGDPDILNPKHDDEQIAEEFYIPEYYVLRVQDFYHELNTRGDAARELVSLFAELFHETKNSEYCILKNYTKVKFCKVTPDDMQNPLFKKQNSSKNHAIALALKLIKEGNKRKDVAIYTGSEQLDSLASMVNIPVEKITREVFSGRRKIRLPQDHDLANIWLDKHEVSLSTWEKYLPKEKPLKPHEYVEFDIIGQQDIRSNFKKFIGRYDQRKHAIVGINYQFDSIAYRSITPLNAGQAILFDALLNPDISIVIVIGEFGTSKTFSAVACGLAQVESGEFGGIFVCPRDASLGDEIGYIPGDATTKTRIKAKPIEDNLREVLKLRGQTADDTQEVNIAEGKKRNGNKRKQKIEKRALSTAKIMEQTIEKYFEFESIIFMGGRSLADKYIIYDEFQDTERHQAKALLSRIGEGSKIVVSGDPNQVNNPHLSKTNNGLTFAANRLMDSQHACIITLTEDEIVRSAAARDIAKYLH